MTPDTYSIDNMQQWKRRFSLASDDYQVMLLAREFMGTLPESERLLLGGRGDLHALREPAAVAEFALYLTQLEMSLAWDDVVKGDIIRNIARVFIEASRRLSALSESRVLRSADDGRLAGS